MHTQPTYLPSLAKLMIVAAACAATIPLNAQLVFADDEGVVLVANEPTAPTATEFAVVGEYLDRVLASKDHLDLIEKASLGHAALEALAEKGESYLASLDALEAKLQRGEALYRKTRAKLATKAEKLELEARAHARCVHHHEAQMARHPKESPAHAEHARRARFCRHQGAGITKNIKLLQITAIDDDPFAKQRANLAAAREVLDLRMADLEHASSAWEIRVVSSQLRELLQGGREHLDRDISDVTIDINALGDEIDMEMQRLDSLNAELASPG